MKKTIFIASMLVIIGTLCGCFVGWTVGKADHKCENLSADIVSTKPPVTDRIDINDETEDDKLQASGAISRIDYPIVELYFHKNKTYKMVVKDFFNGQIIKEYSDKGDFFQFNKEYFSVLICPAGRGSTPRYILEVYEGDKLIKSVEFFEMRKDIF